MSKRTVSGIMLTLLLIGMLTLAFNVQPVKAEPKTIYVDDDNTAAPWDGTLGHPYQNITSALEHASVNDTIYVYNGTYYENLVIAKSISLIGENRDITIIDGSYRTVVQVTASNVNVSEFTIQNAYGSGRAGIWLQGHYCNIIENVIKSNWAGIAVYSDGNSILRNFIIDNEEWGLVLQSSTGNVIRENNISTNSYGFGVMGSYLSDFLHDIDVSNVVNGKPILYLVNQTDVSIDPSIFPELGFLGLVNSRNIRVENLTIEGAEVVYSTKCVIENVGSFNNKVGISFIYSSNSTVVASEFRSCNLGIEISRSHNVTLIDNTVLNNKYGIYLANSNNNTLSGNHVTGNVWPYPEWGIVLLYSHHNTLFGNNVTSNREYGIRLVSSLYNVLRNNSLTSNSFEVEGEYFNDIDTSNEINGKPICYLVNQKDVTIDPSTLPDLGYLAIVNSTNVIVRGFTLASMYKGIVLADTSNSTIEKMNVSNNDIGIYVTGHSTDNTIKNSIIRNNAKGVDLDYYSRSSTVTNNTITNNRYGVYRCWKDNIIKNNIITNNVMGIDLSYTYNNTIEANIITYNDYGIHSWYDSYTNRIIGNKIVNNSYGIVLRDCQDFLVKENNIISNDVGVEINLYIGQSIRFFHNNFINNRHQVYVSEFPGHPEIKGYFYWDNGAEGNYWSDYIGVDLDYDGIGDTPYIIDEDNQDNYPLMNPWSSLPVHNINTGLGYATIQEAIDAPETLDGHTIFVEAGTYYENVTIDKSISLIGEDKDTTVIDGNGSLRVVAIYSDGVSISGFTVMHSYGEPGWGGGGLVVGGVGNVQISDIIACDNDADWGVHLNPNSHNVNITRTVIVNNSRGGLMLHRTWKVKVSNNIITNNAYWAGVRLSFSSNNTVYGNTITNNDYSIHLLDASNNSICGNKIADNNYMGICLDWLSNYNSICGNNITNNWDGIWLDEGSNYNTISENSITKNHMAGIWLRESSDNTLRNNDVSNNGYNFGVSGRPLLSYYIQDIDDSNTVNGKPVYYWVNRRDMTVPLDAGWIALVNCTRITVENLNLTSNGQGVLLVFTTNSTITKNNITNNGIGIDLHLFSNYNTVSGNNITQNSWYGIILFESSNNKIYHNNFVDNTEQVPIYESTNTWDNGYPSGGNYWSDYTERYPDASEIDDSGIWNTPYVIDDYNQDNYPLMNPWTPPPPVLTATVDIRPQALNLRSKGEWITAYIELPEGYDVNDINASSIMLNDTVPAELRPVAVGDYDEDGVPDLMVKFDRHEVIDLILRNYQFTNRFGTVTLTVTGCLNDGTPFQGEDTITIIMPMPRGLRRYLFPI